MEEDRRSDTGELPFEGPWVPLADLDRASRHEAVNTIFGSTSRDIQYQLIHQPPVDDETNYYSFMVIGGNDYREFEDAKTYIAFVGNDNFILGVFDTRELDLHALRDDGVVAPDELVQWMHDDMLEQAKLGTTAPNVKDMIGFMDVIESWSASQGNTPSAET